MLQELFGEFSVAAAARRLGSAAVTVMWRWGKQLWYTGDVTVCVEPLRTNHEGPHRTAAFSLILLLDLQ